MPLSRAELDAALFQLHAALPLWRDALEDESDLRATYAQLADRLINAAHADDRPWVQRQINNIAPELG